jgi:hypothetical protein
MVHKPYQSVVLLLAYGLALHAAPYSPSRVQHHHYQHQQPFGVLAEVAKDMLLQALVMDTTTGKENIRPLIQQEDCPLSANKDITLPEAVKLISKAVSTFNPNECHSNPGHMFRIVAKLIDNCSKQDAVDKDKAKKFVNNFHFLANLADTLVNIGKKFIPPCEPRRLS